MEQLNTFSFGVIIPAAGKGVRMGETDTPKIFIDIDGRPVLQYVVHTIADLDFVTEAVIVTRSEYFERIEKEITADVSSVPIRLEEGGDRRQDSVERGFKRLAPCDFVAIHDGVRPFVRKEDFIKTAEAAVTHGGAVLGVKPKATIKKCTESDEIEQTVKRSTLWEAQTPQIFRYDLFKKGLEEVQSRGIEITDDAQIAEQAGGTVKMVSGSYTNIKITTPEDVAFSQIIAKGIDNESQ
jgi:2-C-methyl-D-erythritol 4-phosphate cytidylyltransferase